MTEDRTPPRRATDIQGKDLGDEFLFYDHGRDRVHVLNETARTIYMLCDGNRTVEQIVQEFARTYELDDETAERDTRETLASLVECGLLES
jgi:hypothetical protein